MFSGGIWIKYPYFLPCAVLAVVEVMAVGVIAICLEEVCKLPATLRYKVILISHRQTVRGGYFDSVRTSRRGGGYEPLLGSSRLEADINEEPVPLRDLLNFRVLIPVACYVCLASLHAGSNAIQPLFLAMPVNIGGLALPSRNVGYIMGMYGIANGICQLFMLGRLVRRLASKLSSLVPSLLSFLCTHSRL